MVDKVFQCLILIWHLMYEKRMNRMCRHFDLIQQHGLQKISLNMPGQKQIKTCIKLVKRLSIIVIACILEVVDKCHSYLLTMEQIHHTKGVWSLKICYARRRQVWGKGKHPYSQYKYLK